MRWVHFTTRLTDVLSRALAVIAVMLIFILVVLINLNVFSRAIFNQEHSGTVEISEYLLLYITFLGAAWLLSQKGHIKVDIFIQRLSAKTQSILELFSYIVGFSIAAILCFYGIEVTVDLYQRGVVSTTILEFPQWIVFLIIPVGSIVLALQCIVNILNLHKR